MDPSTPLPQPSSEATPTSTSTSDPPSRPLSDPAPSLSEPPPSSSAEPSPSPPPSAMDLLLARHRKELHDLTAKLMQKKKSATKKTRRGVLSECDFLEREMKGRHAREIEELLYGNDDGDDDPKPTAPEESQDDRDRGDASVDVLSSKLNSTTLSPPSLSTQPPTTPPPQPKPRKPNRAKARLARRAAEMDSLRTSALAESATSGPTPKDIELSILLPLFRDLQLVVHEIPPDGHCLYSAFADQLTYLNIPLSTPASPLPERERYKLTRKACASYIRSHKEDFIPFLAFDEGGGGDGDIDTHINKIENTAEWGGHLEVLALAKAYDVTVNVVQAVVGRSVERMNDDEEEGVSGGSGKGGKGKRKEAWLAYYRHSFGLGEHYNSLRRIKAEEGDGKVES